MWKCRASSAATFLPLLVSFFLLFSTGLSEEQDLKELNQVLAHIKESYYGTIDVDSLSGSCLQSVMDSLDKDSRLVEGEASSLDFVRGLEEEASVAEARLVTPDIGYVKVSFFGRRTGLHFLEALETVGVVTGTEPVIKGLLLDLRDNPGGHLQSALEVLRNFVPPGKTLLIERTRNGERPYLSEGGGARCGAGMTEGNNVSLPIAILINDSTASSAEIVAATLRYYCGARVVGERSKGQGTIQEVIPLGGQGRSRIKRTLILTVGEYILPDGSQLKDRGVIPDLEVKGCEEQFQSALSLIPLY